MPPQAKPDANRLILALPRQDRQRLLAACEPVELVLADVLNEPGKRIRHVYFPTRSTISVAAPMPGHADLEVGLIGNEGMLGTALVLGESESPLHAVVQGGGPALRIATALFSRTLEQSPALRRGLGSYVHFLLGQLAQAAACNRFHLVEARLARWFLMTQDRLASEEFYATHESLAQMLGVRRVGVTKAATALQMRELIWYRRGHVRILDRHGLSVAACNCYEADKTAYSRALA